MGSTERRCTNFFLAFVILLLGVGSTVLLYYAGQTAVDLFWGADATYKDELGRINHWDVTDVWYGTLILRGWAFGILYVVPGLSGVVAALFYNRPTMVVHLVLAIIALFFGSFLHPVGAVAMVMYRLLVIEGAAQYDPLLSDCIYDRDFDPHKDPKCVTGRRALILAIAAVCVLCVSWIFVLSHVLYCAFTFSSVGKSKKKLQITSDFSNDRGTTDPSSTQTASIERPRSRWRGARPRKAVATPVAPEVPSSSATASIFPKQGDPQDTENAPLVTSEVVNETTSATISQSVSPEDREKKLTGDEAVSAPTNEPESYENVEMKVTDAGLSQDDTDHPALSKEEVGLNLSGTESNSTASDKTASPEDLEITLTSPKGGEPGDSKSRNATEEPGDSESKNATEGLDKTVTDHAKSTVVAGMSFSNPAYDNVE